MLKVKKSGKNEYGYWATGVLSYKGLEIHDIFSVDKELEADKEYDPKNIIIKRTRNGNLRIKLEI